MPPPLLWAGHINCNILRIRHPAIAGSAEIIFIEEQFLPVIPADRVDTIYQFSRLLRVVLMDIIRHRALLLYRHKTH